MSIKLITWNLCWGCMESNETGLNDKSGKIIAEKCYNLYKKNNINVCMENVINLLTNTFYDIIALQEISKFDEFQKKINKLRPEYNFYLSKAGLETIVTFYNEEKFRLIKGLSDKLDVNSRPIHILFLEEKKSYNIFIFINLHNGHYFKYSIIEKKISKLIGELDDSINYFIIIGGDFNESKIYKGLRPFKYTKSVNYSDMIASSRIKPPISCCAGNNYKNISDYFLIGRNLEFIKNNQIVINSNKILASDHLPVEAEIKIQSNDLANMLLILSKKENIVNTVLKYYIPSIFSYFPEIISTIKVIYSLLYQDTDQKIKKNQIILITKFLVILISYITSNKYIELVISTDKIIKKIIDMVFNYRQNGQNGGFENKLKTLLDLLLKFKNKFITFLMNCYNRFIELEYKTLDNLDLIIRKEYDLFMM